MCMMEEMRKGAEGEVREESRGWLRKGFVIYSMEFGFYVKGRILSYV